MGECRILSRSGAAFRDRAEAGRAVAEALAGMGLEGALVLGVPRGGMVTAREVALALGGELDVALARKLRAPNNPELAIGAVAEGGEMYLDERLAHNVGADEAYVERERAYQVQVIAERAERYRQIRPRVPLAGRRVVVTDDGVATGATMLAALRAARQEGPERLVAALPVGPDHTVQELAKGADLMVCLRVPPHFAAVGQFYQVFDQTADAELEAILREEADRAGGGT